MPRNIILVALDHTINDASWRDPMIGVSSWDEYHEMSKHDHANPDVVDLINELELGSYRLVGLTGRHEKARKLTIEWLLEERVELEDILMRRDDDFRPAPELKIAMCEEKWGEKWTDHICFILDDREDVCSAFTSMGITSLQVRARKR